MFHKLRLHKVTLKCLWPKLVSWQPEARDIKLARMVEARLNEVAFHCTCTCAFFFCKHVHHNITTNVSFVLWLFSLIAGLLLFSYTGSIGGTFH